MQRSSKSSIQLDVLTNRKAAVDEAGDESLQAAWKRPRGVRRGLRATDTAYGLRGRGADPKVGAMLLFLGEPANSSRVAAGRLALMIAVLFWASGSGEARTREVKGETFDERLQKMISISEPAEKLAAGEAALEILAGREGSLGEADLRLGLGQALVELARYGEAFEQLEVCYALSAELERPVLLAHSCWLLSLASFRSGRFPEGLDWAAQGADIAEEIGRDDILWRAANVQGLIHESLGQPGEALDAFARGLEAAERSRESAGLAALLSNVGMAHMNLGEFEVSRVAFERARVIETESDNPSGMATSMANLGSLAYLEDDYEEAEALFLEALEMREELGDEVELAFSYYDLGVLYDNTGQHLRGLEYLERAREIRERLQLLPVLATTLVAMSSAYSNLDDFENAERAVEQGIDLSHALELKGRHAALLRVLSGLHEDQGDLRAALDAMRDAVLREGELRTLAVHKRYVELEAEFENNEKKRKIELLEKEKELQAGKLREEQILRKAKQREVELLKAEQELQEGRLREQQFWRTALISGSMGLLVLAAFGWGAWGFVRRSNAALSTVNHELRERTLELERAARRIDRLEGMLPICASCKNIRDERGDWHAVEAYVTDNSDALFSHGICPDCAKEYFPDVDELVS